MRGATQGTIDVIDPGDFNPRSPCGERQEGQMNETDLMHISIHAPHAGSDRFRLAGAGGFHDFNPRSPCGERPACTVLKTDTNRFQSTLPMRGATLD